ncbi:PLP-dependent aminotransferase family protein [Kitasatospora sp. NPDC096077]|uniref:MocR-like pyridoxine biosynthesis transcription factor PdxR n=1 Tax=Kitasatospora sp. NPDC096077 TaxID=3155544 RepID=UPI0033215773
MAWHTLIEVSRKAGPSLTAQIQGTLRREITEAVLLPGTRLPSSRQLSEDLGVSRSVVVEAYGQLMAEGYLEATPGSGTRVAARPTAASPPPTLLREDPAPPVRWDLRTGTAGLPSFPQREWLTCYQNAVRAASRRDLGYPSPSGVPELRAELAGYLGRVHGVHTTPEQVVVVSGFAHALGLVCAVLPELGIDALGMEDPCHLRQRQFVRETGLRPHAVPVDGDGIDVAALYRSGLRAVLVTPAHQFPTGAALTAERRESLARWARDVDGWVIEDDYDGDLWLARGVRIPALQRLLPERTLYGGTASKSLAPGLRLGWLAVPRRLLAPLERVRSRRDLGSDVLTQLALAELMRSGLFDRHLRAQRAHLRGRRESLELAVQRFLPGTRILGTAMGLHAYLRLPDHVDEARLVAAALRRSVLVQGGRPFHHRPRPDAPALVLGYSNLPRSAVTEVLRTLGEACAEQPAGRRRSCA